VSFQVRLEICLQPFTRLLRSLIIKIFNCIELAWLDADWVLLGVSPTSARQHYSRLYKMFAGICQFPYATSIRRGTGHCPWSRYDWLCETTSPNPYVWQLTVLWYRWSDRRCVNRSGLGNAFLFHIRLSTPSSQVVRCSISEIIHVEGGPSTPSWFKHHQRGLRIKDIDSSRKL